MRTALIAALKRTGSGALRAELQLAGRSVLARQVDLLRAHGCEKILCLCERVEGEVLRLQHEVEAAGGSFHALRGFLRLPALVRAEDELVILADGLLPDPDLVAALFAHAPPPRFTAVLPTESPLVAAHPDDFERIDARYHWAGLLAMRGAPVQHLADFPPDADAVSLLLRLALQAGTPIRPLPDAGPVPRGWLIATGEAALAAQEEALIIRAAGEPDWRRPSQAAARLAARALGTRGLERGPTLALLGAGVLLVGAVAASAFGVPGAGLVLAVGGALGAALAEALGRLQLDLLGKGPSPRTAALAAAAVDILAAFALLLALSPAPVGALVVAPLAVLGPVVLGLARLVRGATPPAPLAIAADRAVLLGVLALAAALGLLPLATALFALVLLGGLLLHDGAS